MTPEDALALAERIARRVTKDTGIASAEDYASLAALAILKASEDTQDEALLWTIGKRSIIDQHRNLHGRRQRDAKATAVHVELADDDAPSIDLPTTDEVLARGFREVQRLRQLAATLPAPLTTREREIVSALATGGHTEEIADRLGMTPDTARTHIRNAMRRLGARTRPHAVAVAIARGEIEQPKPW